MKNIINFTKGKLFILLIIFTLIITNTTNLFYINNSNLKKLSNSTYTSTNQSLDQAINSINTTDFIPSSIIKFITTTGCTGVNVSGLSWISAPGDPQDTKIPTVSVGQVTNLQLNWAEYTCYSFLTSTQATKVAETNDMTYMTDFDITKPTATLGPLNDPITLPGTQYTYYISPFSGEVDYGYTTFSVGPTPYLNYGKSTLTVSLPDMINNNFKTSNATDYYCDYNYNTTTISESNSSISITPGTINTYYGNTLTNGQTDFTNCGPGTITYSIPVTVLPPSNPNCTISVSNQYPFPNESFSVDITVNTYGVPPNTYSYSFNNQPISLTTPSYSTNLQYPLGSYTLNFAISTPLPWPGNYSCSTIIHVSNRPYFQVNGSDTQVGLGFCGLSDNNSSASIYGWNNNGLNNSYNQGAGDQYGSIATGSMVGFDSANINKNTNPLGLSFANVNNSINSSTNDNPSAGLFGGFFASLSLPSCGNNYFPDSSILSQLNSPQSSSGSSGGSGPSNNITTYYPIDTGGNQEYYLSSSNTRNISTISFDPITFHSGSNIIIYVKNENVEINNNIILNNSRATAISQLSSFKLVVEGGDIIISPSVNEIDGVYVAEPYKGNGGTIYTCGTTQPTTDCNTPLTVNGSLVANSIKLWRTSGTVGTSNVAETINQPPSEWLSSINNPGPLTINSIQNLPPVF